MPSKDVCIVTDASVQFPKPIFPGRELLTIVPFSYAPDCDMYRDEETIKVGDLPNFISEDEHPLLIPADVSTFRMVFNQLSKQYMTIFAIFMSDQTCGSYSNALEAAENLQGKVNLYVIDSLTTSVGLGWLIQKVVEAILAGKNVDEIHWMIRSLIPRIYTLICTPGLSYLHRNQFLPLTQSWVSEMLGIIPIFTFEEGALRPIEKVSNMRQVYSFYQEFLEEFEDIDQIAFIQSANPNFNDTKTFFDIIHHNFPDTIFSRNLINAPLSLLFGPQANSLIILEKALR